MAYCNEQLNGHVVCVKLTARGKSCSTRQGRKLYTLTSACERFLVLSEQGSWRGLTVNQLHYTGESTEALRSGQGGGALESGGVNDLLLRAGTQCCLLTSHFEFASPAWLSISCRRSSLQLRGELGPCFLLFSTSPE